MKKYYGEQTEKAIKNFPFSFRKLPKEFFYCIVEIKKASALAHAGVGELDNKRKVAIVKACDEILAGKMDAQFILSAFQGGAGTSNHMNVNEVIANRATEIINGALTPSPSHAPSFAKATADKKGEGNGLVIHPNDHVNMSQSTNDVMPSALKIIAYRLSQNLLGTIDIFISTLEKKSQEFKNVYKLGRTHLQDAVPVTLGGEFEAYADNAKQGKKRIEMARLGLLELNMGGTAVGNSINASPKYINCFYKELQKITKVPFKPAKNLMAKTSSNTDLVWLSQSLTAFCVDLSKMSNDLRWLSSGPKGGLGEISLPELQAGSSIMPGKVNPVLSEAISQLYFLVSGNNITIEHGAQGAQLELGVMLPIITDRLIESLTIMDELLLQFSTHCVSRIKVNKKHCLELLENSTAYATLLTPILGYDTVAKAVKESLASNQTLRQIIVGQKLLSEKEFNIAVKSFKP